MLKSYKEIFNFRRASYLLEHFDEYPELKIDEPKGDYDGRNHLRKYIRSSEPIGRPNFRSVKVSYKHARGATDGRVFACYGQSLQSMSRLVRGVLAEGIYYDVDMVNAHPTILLHICQERKVDTPCLREYVNSRDDVLDRLVKAYNSDKSTAKRTIISVIYGKRERTAFAKDPWFRAFKKEMRMILGMAKAWFPNYYETTRKSNKSASTLSRAIGAVEAKLLEIIESVMGCSENAVLVFDGIMVPVDAVGDRLDKMMRMCEKRCLKATGVPIKLKSKPFDKPKGFEVPEDYEPIIPTRLSNENLNDIKALYRNTDYYWYDFHREMTSQVFSSKDAMLEVFTDRIKRVALVAYNMEDHIVRKISEDNMFQFDKKSPRGGVRYMSTDPITGKDRVMRESFARILDVWGAIDDVPFYNSLDFRPIGAFEEDYIEPERTFNTWTGFKAELVDEVDMDYVQPILNHIKIVWASGDEDIYHYLLCWFKLIFTNPSRKSKVAIVLKSDDKQIGKGILINGFLVPYVFGDQYAMSTNGLDKITQRFNTIVMNKLLINCDELSSSNGYHSSFDTMKNRITDPTTTIEPKGGRPFQYPDFCNYIMTTNHDFTIHLEKGDARYCILECSPALKGNYEYFNNLKDLFTQDTADHFFTYICHYDDKGIDIRDIPMTQLKKDMLVCSIPSPIRFLMHIHERVSDECNNFDDWDYQVSVFETGAWIKSRDLYSLFKRWVDESREKSFTSNAFGSAIKKYIVKKRSNGYWYNLLSIKVEDMIA